MRWGREVARNFVIFVLKSSNSLGLWVVVSLSVDMLLATAKCITETYDISCMLARS